MVNRIVENLAEEIHRFWTILIFQHLRQPVIFFISESQHIVIIQSLTCVLLVQSCPTLCNPMDYSPPGSSIHGMLQARILEWVAISFSRGSSQPRDQTWVSCIVGNSFPSESPGSSY